MAGSLVEEYISEMRFMNAIYYYFLNHYIIIITTSFAKIKKKIIIEIKIP
jgi:hypothetical protein